MANADNGDLKVETLLSVLGRDAEAHRGAVNVPVYHASTILYPTVAALKKAGKREHGEVFYGRHGTPTTFALQDTVAKVEGGWRSFAFSSGKAAILAALLAYLKSGDHLLMVDSAYGPSRELAEGLLERLGISHTFYDPLIGNRIADLIEPNTRVVFTESPGSLTFEMQDLPAIAEVAHAAGVTVITDNTWASPLLCDPFALGADVSVQAATKYIVGHSDAMLGLITTTEAVHAQVREAAAELGAPPGPDDCYLAQRGLRTLAVRLERHMETGLKLARWLNQRPEVARVMHPGLEGDPGHALWQRDFEGASGLFGVVLQPGPKEAVAAMLDGMELFKMGYSWGGYESLIVPTYPARARSATQWDAPGPSLRLHAGLEDADDLIADLEAGLERFAAASGR